MRITEAVLAIRKIQFDFGGKLTQSQIDLMIMRIIEEYAADKLQEYIKTNYEIQRSMIT